jgi:hypothetical protein
MLPLVSNKPVCGIHKIYKHHLGLNLCVYMRLNCITESDAVGTSTQHAPDADYEPEVPRSDGDEPELPVNEPEETTTPLVRMRTKRGSMRLRLHAPKRARLSVGGTSQDGTRIRGGRNLMDACKTLNP